VRLESKVLDAANRFEMPPSDAEMADDAVQYAIHPIFARVDGVESVRGHPTWCTLGQPKPARLSPRYTHTNPACE
jgi:hypothetical protein